ncbi:MAG: HAD family hydrolase [Fibrobacter sp.]|nr:HAD family hydrolase [Fibrobacter sp.]
MNRALFLDRDGVINKDVSYPHKPEQIVFVEGIFDLCRKAADRGYLLVVITNQAGIAKGYFSETDVENLHKWMGYKFKEHGLKISAFYFCPFHPEGVVEKYRKKSDCRKPSPGMFIKAAQDLNIDLKRSLMVGDKMSDRINLPELKCIIIKSRYTDKNYDVETLSDIEKFL